MKHKTIRLQSGIECDEGMAFAVEWLNSIPGVQTNWSCQGDPAGSKLPVSLPYVAFSCGDLSMVKAKLDKFAPVIVLTAIQEECSFTNGKVLENGEKSMEQARLALSSSGDPCGRMYFTEQMFGAQFQHHLRFDNLRGGNDHGQTILAEFRKFVGKQLTEKE